MLFSTVLAGLAAVATAGVVPRREPITKATAQRFLDNKFAALPRFQKGVEPHQPTEKWDEYSDSLANIMQLPTSIVNNTLVKDSCLLGEETVPYSLSFNEFAHACKEIDMSPFRGKSAAEDTILDLFIEAFHREVTWWAHDALEILEVTTFVPIGLAVDESIKLHRLEAEGKVGPVLWTRP